ncbi:MAG: GldG family protein [Bacteriovoracaceae bacterium]
MKSWLIKILVFFNVLLYFTSVLLWIATPDNLVLNVSASGFTILFTAILFILGGEKVKRFFLSRFSKRFYSEVVGIFLIAAILSLINYLGFKNYKQWDISSDEMNTLSEQSKIILKNVKEGTKVTLYAKREQWEQVLPILRLYHDQKSDLVLTAVDIEAEPHKAKQEGLTQFPVVVIDSGKKKNIVQVMDELSLTNGFLKITQDKIVKIYYTTGHGELDLEDATAEGASILMTMMKNSNMEVVPLPLMKIDKIPEDATALLLLGPQDGLLVNEVKLLKDYLLNGGRMILTVNPDFKGDRLKLLREMLLTFGLKINNDIVLDRLSSVHNVDATIPIVEKYKSTSPIMKNFKGTTIFAMTNSIELLPTEDYIVESLVETSPFPASWAEKNLNQVQSGKVTFDANIDLKGPITMAAVSFEKSQNDLETKISVFGSTSLIVNGYANQSPNFNLFLNAVAWVVGNEGLITLNRPILNQERIMMSSPQIGTIFYFSVIFLPLSLFAFSFYLYRRRLRQ